MSELDVMRSKMLLQASRIDLLVKGRFKQRRRQRVLIRRIELLEGLLGIVSTYTESDGLPESCSECTFSAYNSCAWARRDVEDMGSCPEWCPLWIGLSKSEG